MSADDELEEILLEGERAGDVTSEEAGELRKMSKGGGEQRLASDLVKEDSGSNESDLRRRLNEMKLGEKIKIAMFGNSACRAALIQDPNKMVQLLVLKNPRIQLNEIEAISNNNNISDLVLRAIASNKNWMSQYTVKHSIVCNPKTPQDVSLKWLRYLQAADLKKISRSKNLPQIVATTAAKRLKHVKR